MHPTAALVVIVAPPPPLPLATLAQADSEILALDTRGQAYMYSLARRPAHVWVPIDGPRRVTQLACATACQLLLDSDGRVWLRKYDGAGGAVTTPLTTLSEAAAIHVAAGHNAAAVLTRAGEVLFWPMVNPREPLNPRDPRYEGARPFTPPPPARLPIPGAVKVAVWAPDRPYWPHVSNMRPAVAVVTDDGDVLAYRDKWERVPGLCAAGTTDIAIGSCMLGPGDRGVFITALPGPRVARLADNAVLPVTVLPVTRLLPASTRFTALIPNNRDIGDSSRLGFGLLLGDDGVLYKASVTGPDVVVSREPVGSGRRILSATYEAVLVAGDERVPRDLIRLRGPGTRNVRDGFYA